MEQNGGKIFNLKSLRDTLTNLDQYQQESYDKRCASGDKMSQMLIMLFGKQAAIISPLRIQQSQNCREEADAIQAIDCVRKIQQLKEDDRQKPIIILWRTNSDVQTVENMRSGPHWHTYVLFLSERKMYFRDSLSKKTKICNFLVQLLSSELNLKNQIFGGLVPQLTIINMQTGQCPQQRHNDAGHWAVYNTIMLTYKGISVKNLATVSIPNGRKLRALFSDLVKYEKDKSLNANCDQQLSQLVESAKKFYRKIISNHINIQRQQKENLQETIDKEKPTLPILQQIANYILSSQKLSQNLIKQGVQKILWKIPASLQMKNQCQVQPLQISCDYHVNHTSFQRMLGSQHFYIDKTLFIQPCFKQGSRILITRPSGFGKTTFAKMLKYFFSFQIKKENINYYQPLMSSITNPQVKKQHFQHKYRHKKSIIAHQRPHMLQQVGIWPVVYLTFIQENYKHTSIKCFYHSIRNAIKEHNHYLRPYLEHKINEPQNKHKSQDAQDLKQLCSLMDYKQEKQGLQLVISLCWLCQLLQRLFQKKVILIIDDVDKYLTYHMSNRQLYEEIRIFQIGLLKHTLNNQTVYSAIMLGSFEHLMFQQIDKIRIYSMVSDKKLFSTAFGFTEDQLDQMLEIVAYNNWLGQKKKLQEWYNGYGVFGEPLYKIKPIIDFIQKAENNQPEAFDDYIQPLQNQQAIQQLLKKNIGKWSVELNKLIFTKTIQLTKSKCYDVTKISSFQEFATLLASSGYLTPLPKGKIYKIHNNFIRKDFYQRFLAKQLDLNNGASGVLKTVTQIYKSLQYFKQFAKAVDYFCLQKIKYQSQNQAYFQSLIGGILAMANVYLRDATHTVEFQYYTTSLHRIDNMFCPIKRKSGSFLVFEYKVGKQSQKNDKITEALWQLYSNQYITVPYKLFREGQGWNEIIMRAVVFFSNSKFWKVQIVEYIHSFKQAKEIINIFGSYFKPKMSRSQIIEAKKAVLKYFKAKTIQNILDKYKSTKIQFVPPPTTSQRKRNLKKELMQIQRQFPSLQTRHEGR